MSLKNPPRKAKFFDRDRNTRRSDTAVVLTSVMEVVTLMMKPTITILGLIPPGKTVVRPHLRLPTQMDMGANETGVRQPL